MRTVSFFFAATLIWATGPQLDEARKLYQLTEFERSIQVIQTVHEKDRDGAAWELMGMDYYGLADYKKATEALDKALALEPENSEFHLWMGRAYGRRAETSSMVTAPGYASKARQHFEKAAQLNPKNLE